MGNAVQPNDIGAMFGSLKKRFPQYNVTYLSEPPYGPWVAIFDNFVMQEEADVVLQLTAANFKRSKELVRSDPKTGLKSQVVSPSNTSSESWCGARNNCYNHPVVAKLIDRIADVVNVAPGNFEAM